MRNAVLTTTILGSLFAIGCSKAKDSEQVATGPVDVPASTVAPTAPAAPAGSAAPLETPPTKLDCDKVLPPTVRDTHFAGFNIENGAAANDASATCKITTPSGAFTFDVRCTEDVTASKAGAVALLEKDGKHKPLAGVGDPAFVVEDAKTRSVTAWDTDSSCQITATLPTTVDATAFTRDALAALPVK